jgi:hypothetical protein
MNAKPRPAAPRADGRREWRRTFANGVTRTTGTDGIVTVRPAWDGGTRVVVARARDGIYYPTHERRFV